MPEEQKQRILWHARGDALGKARSGKDRRLSVYRGMYLGDDESLTSADWIEKNVRRCGRPVRHIRRKPGPPPNPHGATKEGDTPSWFYFLPDGLSDPEEPETAGWGGRWAVEPDRRRANHPPTTIINRDRSRNVLRIAVAAGSEVRLSVEGSTAPRLTAALFFARESSSSGGPERSSPVDKQHCLQ